MTGAFEAANRAAAAILDGVGVDGVDAVVVLGSGFGDYAGHHPSPATLSYGDIPGFPAPSAAGHAGTASVIEMGDNAILVLAGRAHAYEGHDLADVVLPVRAAILAGAGTVILTNAAGGIADHLHPGDLGVVADHLSLTARTPLLGPNDERLGPRFPDLTDLYSPRLRNLVLRTAAAEGMEPAEVVYAWWLGPAFETPAEIRMLRTLGADVVGMSTVPEAIAARHMGSEILALSLVTNRAAGLGDGPVSSEEVLEAAAAAQPRVEALLDRLLRSPELAPRT